MALFFIIKNGQIDYLFPDKIFVNLNSFFQPPTIFYDQK